MGRKGAKSSCKNYLGAFKSVNLQTYSSNYHIPVLLREVLHALIVDQSEPAEQKVVLDCTLGGGGHSLAILDHTPKNTLLFSIDRDKDALSIASQRLLAHKDRWTPLLGNYRDAPELLAAHNIDQVDALLLDAGVSSYQLDEPSRGFSFRMKGPLDMRMGADAIRLDHWLEMQDEETIGKAIAEYGEMPGSYRIGRAIKRAFERGEISDTQSLANVVEKQVGVVRTNEIHPATLVFQALRIATNDELRSLQKLIEHLPILVKPGGRIAIISFHSLEDRLVKQGFTQHASPCTCPSTLPMCVCEKQPYMKVLTKKPITAQQDELLLNPRARSAKLRVAQRV